LHPTSQGNFKVGNFEATIFNETMLQQVLQFDSDGTVDRQHGLGRDVLL
jgi:hypothetical protein